MPERIAFIGLGNMGLPMAGNLLKAGHAVTGFDLMPAANEAAARAGIAVAASAPEAVRSADAVITMLPDGKSVLEFYGSLVLQAATPGTLFVDSSTIDVASARAAHELAGRAGMASLDAPVSGGVGGAAAGTLTFMVGGAPEALGRGEPLLKAMGRRVVHCGGPGGGQAAKICNNMILGISMIGVCEAFVLAERLGLSHQALFDVASTSSGQCWALSSNCPVPGPLPASPANHGYKPGFAAALMLKDLRLSQAAAQQSGARTELGAHAAALYEAFVEKGGSGLDFSAIIDAIRAAG
jgi:3-hydroxyisobutyrate dehydrogenase